MKKISLSFLILYSSLYCIAQCPYPDKYKYQEGNEIRAMITNNGSLFSNGTGNGHFYAPAPEFENESIIVASGLWMGGYVSESLKLAAMTYGSYNGAYDYYPGPLEEEGYVLFENCENFNKIWRVQHEKIEAHKADYSDNGIINNRLGTIYAWPGKGNPHFEQYNGFALPEQSIEWAPFYDFNGDQIYNPDDGDYPHPPNTAADIIPAAINWTVFNDALTHSASGGDPNLAQIQLTSWSFNCQDNIPLSRTIFTSHKIINRNNAAIDSFHVGLWFDSNIYCLSYDFLGSIPGKNAFYAYDNPNIECIPNGSNHEIYPSTLSFQFLNKELSYFTYYNNPSSDPIPPSGTLDPTTGVPSQYYNYLTGSWNDGTAISYGGSGFNPSDPTPVATHVFPDHPADVNGWSMAQENLTFQDRRGLGSHHHGQLGSQEALTIDVAYTFHQTLEYDDQLDVIDQMYLEIDQVKEAYDFSFNYICTVILDNENPVTENFKIYPNPSSGLYHIEANKHEVLGLKLYDINAKLLWQNNNRFSGTNSFSFDFLSPGIYVLQIYTEKGIFSKKLILIE